MLLLGGTHCNWNTVGVSIFIVIIIIITVIIFTIIIFVEQEALLIDILLFWFNFKLEQILKITGFS
jgi:hypothetical protein